MDEKKKRLIVIGGLIVVVIILLLLFWPKGSQEVETSQNTTPASGTVSEPSRVSPLVEREVPGPSQAGAEAIARSFAERYASFSAESHFANYVDLFPVMTGPFRTYHETLIETAEPSDVYYGVTSKIVSLTTVSLEDGSAVIDAALQRTEARGSAQNVSTKYETLRMDLVFQNGSWLVDGAEWSN